MPQTRVYTRSFTGGEVSPYLYGRLDFDKYQTGALLCRNFTVRPEGPVQNRAGFAFYGEAKFANKQTRLIPFIFNDSQALVIELGDFYARFFQSNGPVLTNSQTLVSIVGNTINVLGYIQTPIVGRWVYLSGRPFVVTSVSMTSFTVNNTDGTVGTPNPAATSFFHVYEISTPYPEAVLFGIHYVQSADVMTLVHPLHPPAELRRLSISPPLWQYQTITFGATLTPTSLGSFTTRTTQGPGTAVRTHKLYRYTVVGSGPQDESVVGNYITGREATAAEDTPTNVITAFSAANPTVVTIPVNTLASIPLPFVQGASGNGGVGQLPFGSYLFKQISPTTFEVYDLNQNPINGATLGAYGGGMQVLTQSTYCDLNLAGSSVRLTVSNGTANATSYRFYKSEADGPYGFIGESLTPTFVDNNITPDISIQPPIVQNPLAGPNFPQAVGYYQQRRAFGGTLTNPQTVYMTRTGTESNFNTSFPTRDDDALIFRVDSRVISILRHFVPLSDLLALAGDVEFRIEAIGGGAITPSTLSVKPDNYEGASNVQPVLGNSHVLYSAARGQHIRELAYSFNTEAFVSEDVSLLASHLFDGFTITDLTFAKAPIKTLYACRSDGVLLACTYLPQQEVRAWYQVQSINGAIRSCCAIPEATEDHVYIVVDRVVNGIARKYIERQMSRDAGVDSTTFLAPIPLFSDSGATVVSGTPFSAASGIYWLEGQTVNIVVDGGVQTPKVVTGGAIFLDTPGSTLSFGLPITAQVETLPVTLGTAAYGQPNAKNANKVTLQLFKASGLKVGPNFDKLTQVKQRSSVTTYGVRPEPLSGRYEVAIFGSWDADGTICFEQTEPLAVTIQAFGIELAVGG